jgi:acyl-coenzyme A synthetase/AMP-(fatty) acid ligase
LLSTSHPVNAALALASLDGLAARVVLRPPDLADHHLPRVIAEAGIDGVVHDGADEGAFPADLPRFAISQRAEGAGSSPLGGGQATEWVLFTSGTTGAPKMAVHDLAGLTHAFASSPTSGEPIVWATFYDIRRYGGLQMLLRALTGGHTMLLTSPGEPVAHFLGRLGAAGVTNLSGTPSHWRSALMSPALAEVSPRYVRLSGEIANQALLDSLARAFPAAAIGHAYASTEAGVGFEVNDGLEGFPAAYLSREGPVRMRVRRGVLQIRSPRTALRYIGSTGRGPTTADGFVDTGDLVERRGDRLHFVGRASGVINVGGLKVHPEEVEAVINACPGVRGSLVKGRRSPITGAVLTADLVLEDPGLAASAVSGVRQGVIDRCRSNLAAFKVPVSLRFVDALPLTAGGKLERRNA